MTNVTKDSKSKNKNYIEEIDLRNDEIRDESTNCDEEDNDYNRCSIKNGEFSHEGSIEIDINEIVEILEEWEKGIE